MSTPTNSYTVGASARTMMPHSHRVRDPRGRVLSVRRLQAISLNGALPPWRSTDALCEAPIPSTCPSDCRQAHALGNLARLHEAPQRNEQLACQCHDESFSASTVGLSHTVPVPLNKGRVRLVIEHAPRKLDHDVTDTCAAGFHQTAVAAAAAALIRRSGEADEPRQRPAIRKVAHEHLGDKRSGRRGPHTRDGHQLLKPPSGLGRKTVFALDPFILDGAGRVTGFDPLDLVLEEREPFE